MEFETEMREESGDIEACSNWEREHIYIKYTSKVRGLCQSERGSLYFSSCFPTAVTARGCFLDSWRCLYMTQTWGAPVEPRPCQRNTMLHVLSCFDGSPPVDSRALSCELVQTWCVMKLKPLKKPDVLELPLHLFTTCWQTGISVISSCVCLENQTSDKHSSGLNYYSD